MQQIPSIKICQFCVDFGVLIFNKNYLSINDKNCLSTVVKNILRRNLERETDIILDSNP